MNLTTDDIARLRSQMSRAEIVLFTGAGFSLGASDRSGKPLPSSNDLKEELWEICFPGMEFDQSTSLSDLYATGLRHKKQALAQLLETRLAVDPDSLPDYYRAYFDLPWLRVYTLNVDNIEVATRNRFELERTLLTISATALDLAYPPLGRSHRLELEVIHLNGVVPSPLDLLTFSETQYAERIANQEPWYSRCVVDITCRPVVFIGTLLQESLLWQHMELRRKRETQGRDLRPTSILVTPKISLPRQDILRQHRIEWVEGTAESFAREVLAELSQERGRGFAFIREYSEVRETDLIPLVSQLASERPHLQTEYLLGEEPHWSDLLSGRATERSHDKMLLDVATEILSGKKTGTALAVTGTAGTGKSTALMSLVLRLSNDGIPVLWLDKDSEVTPLKIRNKVQDTSGKLVLAIDDADLYGRDLVELLKDLVPRRTEFLFVFAVRSGKLDEIMAPIVASRHLEIIEHVVPPLTDEDIDGLISVLDRHNRLGKLKGEGAEKRRFAFREQAGRQMLVAMIQATSNETFENKACAELVELSQTQRYVYSIVCVASALRYYLSKDEILLACGTYYPDALSSLERLTAHHLIAVRPPAYHYRARHRVIADIVFDKLVEMKEFKASVEGLAWAVSSKLNPTLHRTSRLFKFLAELINHSFLRRLIGIMDARDIYEELENILTWDYHYWLQRGSLEVEAGDIRLAENFLNSARSMGSGDYRVQTAYGYMLMRKAWEMPVELHAQERLGLGVDILEEVIEKWGGVSAYPFHVIGSQGLAWVHRAPLNTEEKRSFLGKLLSSVNDGVEKHPRSSDLQRLLQDIKKEILLTVTVPPQNKD